MNYCNTESNAHTQECDKRVRELVEWVKSIPR